MEKKRDGKSAYYISQGLSYLLHPFLMPVYLIVLLFLTGEVPLHVLPQVRSYMLAVVVVNTLLVPAMAIVLLKLLGAIPDYSLSTRRERIVPLLVVALCYGLCAWLLSGIPALFIMRRCVLAGMACIVFAFLVNLKWQISLHMTAMGGAVGILFILFFAGFYNLVWLFCAAVILAGALGSARLYLGKHTISQVAAGFFGGAILSVAVMLLSI